MNTRLEKKFSELYGTKYSISFINGTATMHAILLAKGIGKGDEVIVPPLTMASTTFAVLQVGATPIYADVDSLTYQIDPKSIEKKITNNTKAIITVALYGLSPDMDEIMKLASDKNIFVLEDNAETMKSYYKGKLAGTIGHAASFSFQSSKHLTAGEGGMVITDDENLALDVRRVSSLGYSGISSQKGKITKNQIQSPDYFRHVSSGFNFRMPELCAAVALGQLERVDEFVQRRIDVANLFLEIVNKTDWITAQHTPEHCVNSYWTFVSKLENPAISWTNFRDKFQEFGGDGIYALEVNLSGTLYKDLGLGEESPSCPIAEELQMTLLQFKTNYWIWDEAIEQAEVLKKTIAYFDNL